jgi:acylphosphatase
VFVSGIVQGVGFRAYIQNQARRNQIQGWIKNLNDGRVEVLLVGSKENTLEMIKLCKRGSPWSKVSDVQVNWKNIQDDYDSFSIMP